MTYFLTVLALLVSSPLLAQGYYYGAVDDVYPIGLEVASDTVAWAWIGSATRAVRFAGRPSQNGRVKWRALDTTLVLDGTLREGDFVGKLRNGLGREQSVLAKAYAGQRSTLSVPFRGQTTTPTPKARQWVTEAARQLGIGRTQDTTFVKTAAELPADFLTFCGSQKWVSTWTTATRDYRLTLTLLPTGRLRGSLFLAASQTTLLADGEARGSTLSVVLSQLNHETVGTLEAAADERVDDWGRLTAKLDLGAGGQTLRFALSERIPLECRQEGGSLDLLLPRIGETTDRTTALRRLNPMTPADYFEDRWARLLSRAQRGSVWFEPLRLDAYVMSGWIHASTDAGEEAVAFTVDRRTATVVGERRFSVGSRKERLHVRQEQRRRAISTHPLYADPDFRSWAADQALTQVTVAAEGLVYTTERHPVYGRLIWLTSWDSLDESLRAATTDLRADGYSARTQP